MLLYLAVFGLVDDYLLGFEGAATKGRAGPGDVRAHAQPPEGLGCPSKHRCPSHVDSVMRVI